MIHHYGASLSKHQTAGLLTCHGTQQDLFGVLSDFSCHMVWGRMRGYNLPLAFSSWPKPQLSSVVLTSVMWFIDWGTAGTSSCTVKLFTDPIQTLTAAYTQAHDYLQWWKTNIKL